MVDQAYKTRIVAQKLRRHKQSLKASGILDRLTKIRLHGDVKSDGDYYDAKEVDELAIRMIRRDAAAAFERISKASSILLAYEYTDPSLDTSCPECLGIAVKEKEFPVIWCPRCGFVEIA